MIQLTGGEKAEKNTTWGAYLLFLLCSYIISGALLLVLAFIVLQAGAGSRVAAAGVAAIYVISCFAGGFLAGKKAKNRKYLWGLGMGGAYFLILLLVSMALGMAHGSGNFLTVFMLCAGGGMLGGMVS